MSSTKQIGYKKKNLAGIDFGMGEFKPFFPGVVEAGDLS
jgi:hypothetical protein